MNQIIYSLLGLIVLNADDNAEIQVKQYNDAPANMLWVFIRGNRYAFRYEHNPQSIEIRAGNARGDVLHRVDNASAIADLRTIFDRL